MSGDYRFEPGAPERSFKLTADIGVYRSGLLLQLTRWSPAHHARGSVATFYREWRPAEDLDFSQALDRLIDRLVIYRSGLQ